MKTRGGGFKKNDFNPLTQKSQQQQLPKKSKVSSQSPKYFVRNERGRINSSEMLQLLPLCDLESPTQEQTAIANLLRVGPNVLAVQSLPYKPHFPLSTSWWPAEQQAIESLNLNFTLTGTQVILKPMILLYLSWCLFFLSQKSRKAYLHLCS